MLEQTPAGIGRIPHGMRGLKFLAANKGQEPRVSRIPHGMRGLKSSLRCWCLHLRLASHPAWDAWIEMPLPITGGSVRKKSHPAWDAWIEIISFERFTGNGFGRIPHGMRGLKSALFVAR